MNPVEIDFIEQLISERKLSPGARGMDIADVIDQYNATNVLDVDDPDFLVHPQVMPTMILTPSTDLSPITDPTQKEDTDV